MMLRARGRRLPIGAEVVPGGVHFRVWAPRRRRVTVVLDTDGADVTHPLAPEEDGYFAGLVPGAGAGSRYRYLLDEGDGPFPDPASRYQPEGPHGPSEVVDASAFRWTDADWPGCRLPGQVVYELHVGTFTPEGTWAAAADKLEALRDLGVTLVEMMPVAEFPGRFGWGYDGVDLFAPTRLYGAPDDLRRFVDRAHALGLGVILDVVYNHLGPDGNYLAQFSNDYFTTRYSNEWGDALNFDGPRSAPVRELFIANAGYWVTEFHLDGLRLDATQTVHDGSSEHLLAALSRHVREVTRPKDVLLIAENEPQHARLVRSPRRGGYGLDALWNDDLHHAARVALTGHSEAYYTDYRGTPQELISAFRHGFLYQGQHYRWQRQSRGRPAPDLPGPAFVNFLQNHDQIANSAAGLRLDRLTTPGRLRAMTAAVLLAPGTPMLFQGQEFGASTPFVYFADHGGDLAEAVARGRREFLAQFPSIAAPESVERLPAPHDERAFERSKLDWSERDRHVEALALHRDLLRLRREDPVFAAQDRAALEGAVLGDEAFALRWFDRSPDGAHGDRLLLVNLGRDRPLEPCPEPLLAPPPAPGGDPEQVGRWVLIWSSEAPRYGGGGTPPVETDGRWRLPGHATVVLAAAAPAPTQDAPKGDA